MSEHVKTTEPANLFKALKAFEGFVLGQWVKPKHIIKGDQLGSLPPTSNNFVVNTALSHQAHGTPIKKTVNGELHISELVEVLMQVDMYSENAEDARQMAQTLKSFCFSGAAIEFLKPYGVGLLYADDVRNLTAPNSEGKPLPRWMSTLRLTYWHDVHINMDTFNTVDVDLANVDVKFKPTE